MVIAAMREVNNSPVFKRMVEDHALRQHQLSMVRDADMLEQQGRIAALAMEKQEVLARLIEERREAHQERMQKDAQQHSDEAAERKKVADQFPPGSAKTIAWLRGPGRGDILNRTGDRTNYARTEGCFRRLAQG